MSINSVIVLSAQLFLGLKSQGAPREKLPVVIVFHCLYHSFPKGFKCIRDVLLNIIKSLIKDQSCKTALSK